MKAETRAAILLVAPPLLLITLFFMLPVLAGFVLSLTDFDLYSIGNIHNLRLIGLRNYQELFGNAIFWRAFLNTIEFTLLGVPLTIVIALGAALLVNARITRWKGFFRTVYFAPVVTTLVAVSIVFKYLYHPRFGVLNRALSHLGIAPIDWLGDPRLALLSIVILAVWRTFGYTMIIFIAGLQTIPDELYEAARIDGAGPWAQFRHVTLPMLGPTLLFIGIVTGIGYFQLFAEPYVMTYGGPLNHTLSAVMLMYQQGFKWWRMGYGAAIAFILFLAVGGATLLQLRFQEKR
jgi:multiple sugar transport system permease protein